jgi:hypothetical protein
MGVKRKHLLIDDFRDFYVDKICRTYDEGIAALSSEVWDVLWLDHDLGPMSGDRHGGHVMDWLEEHPENLPGLIICVSSNPPGRQYIESVVKKIYGRTFTFKDACDITKET